VKKIVNFRPLLLLFLTLAFGIFAASAFLFNNVAVKVVASIFLTAILFVFVLSLIKRNNILKGKSFFVFFMLIVFLFGFSNLFLQINSFESLKLESKEYAVEAIMTDKIEFREYGAVVYLKNATVTLAEETNKLKKNLKLTINYSEGIEVENINAGSKVVFVANIFDYDLIKDGQIKTFYYTNNLGYYASVDFENIVIMAGDATLSENIKASVKTMLNTHLTYDNANMAYAVLFGDKTLIDSVIYESFAISGIAHILAVSGLHIGFLVLIILFILKNLKLNKKLQFVFLAVVLFCYSYLCAFSPSVVRASIMALTLLLGHLIGEQNDNLSSLSFAGIIILVIKPISLFTAGFLLSFASVFAIFTLFPVFNKMLKKLDLPNWLISTISLTLAAQIGTLPLVVHFFGSFSLLSVVTNVLALPLFTLGYLFLFDAVILSFIFPFFSFLFVVPNLSFSFVYLIAKLISHISFSTLELFSFGLVASLTYYLLIFVLSKFVMLKITPKVIIANALVVVMAVSIIFANLPASFDYNSLTKIYGAESATVVTTSDNLVYLVETGELDSWDLISLEKYLKLQKIKKIEAIVMTNYTEQNQSALVSLASDYLVNCVFIPYTDNNVLLFSLISALPFKTELNLLEATEETFYKSLALTSYTYSNNGLAIKLKSSDFTAMFAKDNLSLQQASSFSNLIDNNVNILVLDKIDTNLYNTLSQNINFGTVNHILAKTNLLDFVPNELYDTNTFGSLQVRASYDTLHLDYFGE
jgi:competence protein ComEC